MTIHPDDRMTTNYEWCIETVVWDFDPDMQDIEDLHFHDKLKDIEPQVLADALRERIFKNSMGVEHFTRLGLRRDRGCNAEGVMDRQHAYLKGKVLTPTFDEGAKVPVKFHTELATQVAWLGREGFLR